MSRPQRKPLSERALDAHARYDLVLDIYRREESLWRDAEKRRSELSEQIDEAKTDDENMPVFAAINDLFVKPNGHGLSANKPMEQARLARAEIIAILCEAGFDHDCLMKNPPPERAD